MAETTELHNESNGHAQVAFSARPSEDREHVAHVLI